MIFQNVEFHNVAQLVPKDGGWAMPRLPESVRSRLDTENSVTQSFSTSGVELRFRMGPEGADLLLHMPDFPEKLPLQIMHGSFQGYWDYSAKTLGTEPTRIHIAPLQNAEALHRVTQQEHLPFHPELVRILLPYCPCIFDGVEGDVQPPQPGDEPEGCLMMVGSSITHGSLAMGSRQCYAHQLAHRLHMDWLNLGLAGACRLQEAMAEHIVSRRDWMAATVEMGVNMLGDDEALFRSRVRRFCEILKQDGRPVFTTDIFRLGGEDGGKIENFRRIVQQETSDLFHYTPALSLLSEVTLLSADLVHPSVEGHSQIAARWADAIAPML